jgi:hypothetical protein
MELKEIGCDRLDKSGSRWGLLARCCEDGNEHFVGSVKDGTLLTSQATTSFLNKVSGSWSYVTWKYALLSFTDHVYFSDIKNNSVALVRKRTIPTERPPLSAK